MSNESEKKHLKPLAKTLASETSGSGSAGNKPMTQHQTAQAAGSASNNAPGTDDAGLSVELQGQLGRHLRSAYRELVDQPVPEKFLKLLEQLKQTEDPPKEGK